MVKFLKPVDCEEAWAVGVTYKRQAMEHDKDLNKKGKRIEQGYHFKNDQSFWNQFKNISIKKLFVHC